MMGLGFFTPFSMPHSLFGELDCGKEVGEYETIGGEKQWWSDDHNKKVRQ